MEDPLLACKNAYFYIKELKPPKTLNLGGIKKMYRDVKAFKGFLHIFLILSKKPSPNPKLSNKSKQTQHI